MHIGAIVWGVKDLEKATTFWKAALNYVDKYPPNDEWVALVPMNGPGIQLSLQRVKSAKAQRHHLDLFTDNQDAEIERLVSLGATRVP